MRCAARCVVACPVANQNADGRGLSRLPCVSHGAHWLPRPAASQAPCTRHSILRSRCRRRRERSGSAPGAKRAPIRWGLLLPLPSRRKRAPSPVVTAATVVSRSTWPSRCCCLPPPHSAHSHTHTHANTFSNTRTYIHTHTHTLARARRSPPYPRDRFWLSCATVLWVPQ